MNPLPVSLQEEDLLIQLRQNVEDLEISSEYKEKFMESKNLVRWLRARNLNLRGAEQLFRKHISWRQEINIDKLAEHEIPVPKGWEKYFQFEVMGFNDNGAPMHLFYGKTFEIARAFNAGHKDILMQRLFSEIERAWNLCLKNSHGKDYIPQFVSIYDFSGVTYRLLSSTDALAAALTVPKVFDENYPECIGKVFVVNTPWYLMWLLKLIQSTLSPKTAAKVAFLGCDKQEWSLEISKRIPLHKFPQRYGGDMDDDSQSQDAFIGTYEMNKCIQPESV